MKKKGFDQIRRYLLDSWQQPNWLTVVLWPLSVFYRGLFALRRWCYGKGIFSSYRAPVPVLVVGNLTVGGTGKTPLVIYLVELLRANGFTPGVISRGYAAKAPEYPLDVTVNTEPSECGDEPALIVRRTKVPMVVGPNRRQSIERLVAQHDIDIVVSDDGLQHLAMQRDVEVCVVDGAAANQNRYLLPAGPYRESLSRLASVDLIVHHGASRDSARGFAMTLKASLPKPLVENSPLSFNYSGQLHAVAGIGRPQRFFDTCEALGLKITPHHFSDHHQFCADDLAFGSASVLMTEKDAVKCAKFATDKHWYLPVNAKLSDEFTTNLITKLHAAVERVENVSGIYEMDTKLLELLVCPVTKGPLKYDKEAQELISLSAKLAYPVRDGIPVLLEDQARDLNADEQ